jgi:hypothetical protein
VNRVQAVQYQVSGVGVLQGADTEYDGVLEAPCVDCGEVVDLQSAITLRIVEADGSESEQVVSEAAARALLHAVDLPPPPVMCGRHETIDMGASCP